MKHREEIDELDDESEILALEKSMHEFYLEHADDYFVALTGSCGDWFEWVYCDAVPLRSSAEWFESRTVAVEVDDSIVLFISTIAKEYGDKYEEVVCDVEITANGAHGKLGISETGSMFGGFGYVLMDSGGLMYANEVLAVIENKRADEPETQQPDLRAVK